MATQSENLFPTTDNTISLGSNSKRWSDVYALEFHGKATSADTVTSLSNHTLDSLNNVSVANPNTNSILQYDGANWVANSAANPTLINDLTDVDSASPVSGMFLRYNASSSKWEATTVNPANITPTFVGLADTPSSYSANQLLKVNSSGNAIEFFTNPGYISDLSAQTTDDLAEGSTNLYYTDARWDTRFSNRSTTNLPEGSNLYFTNARADARIAAASLNDLSDVNTGAKSNDDVLTWDNANSYWKSSPVAIGSLGGVTITSPSSGQVLKYNGSAWVNAADADSGTFSSLTDVGISARANNAVVFYNATTAKNEYTNSPTFDEVTLTGNLNLSANSSIGGTITFTDTILPIGEGSSNTTAIGIRADKGTGSRHAYLTWSKSNNQWESYYSDQPNGNAPFVTASINAVLKGNLEAQVTAHILPSTTNTYDLGSTAKAFRKIYGEATSASYADLAEMYAGDENYEVGTVVVIGGTNEVTACNKHADSKLAGVVSENPGYLMNRDIEAEFPVCVGFVGRVPVKVVGHIKKGDLLTTSSIKGCATKFSQGTQQVGTIIGVALQDKTEEGESTIEVMLKRC
tara:strand:+ start:12684 stop:14414 length:1731 start_codon:yes stop_codon:yes gene_type:complete